jgi:hypothetical protein
MRQNRLKLITGEESAGTTLATVTKVQGLWGNGCELESVHIFLASGSQISETEATEFICRLPDVIIQGYKACRGKNVSSRGELHPIAQCELLQHQATVCHYIYCLSVNRYTSIPL